MKTIPKKLGRYNILQEVGRGSMGVVYKASDPVIEREVAIKAIQLAFNVTSEEKQIYLSRFFREAKAAGKLNHPNIVTIYDVNEDKETGTPFIVMEYLEGTTLQEIIVDGILLPLEDVNNIIIQIADALNYAHKQGVVHRDVKSANIILVEGMKPKITDFGIARMSSSDLTKSGQFMGTPNYMSPEQIDGKIPVDGRSDLFALGVIFYLLLTGERPFSGDSFTSISYKIVHVDPLPPRTLNPGVPESYNRVISRLLAKDPAERYKTGAELIADMRTIGHETVGEAAARQSQSADITSVPAEKPDRNERDSIASADTFPSNGESAAPRASRKNLLVGALVFGVLFIVGAWSFLLLQKRPEQPAFRIPGDNQTQSQASPRTDPGKQPTDPPARLHAKLDLALNYYRNGFYAKSIELFEEVLRLDPQNPEAKKYIQLAQEKARQQTSAGSRKIAPPTQPKPASQHPAAPTQPQVAKTAPPPPSGKSSVKTQAKESRIDFELEHPFPSGTFSIYLGEQLLYVGELSATSSKKLLLVPIRIGKLAGSVAAPAGHVELRMQIVCSEQGVKAEKKSAVDLQKGGISRARIKYITVSKQLEVKWL